MAANRFSIRPLYMQLRDALLARIATGEWKGGSIIPNEGDLAREFGVSAGTMRKALDLLEAERVLTRRQGRGTFVNDPNSAEFALRYSKLRDSDGLPIVAEAIVGAISEAAANEQELRHLALEPSAKVYRYRRTYAHEGRVFMIDEVSVPAKTFPDLENEKDAALDIVSLAQRYGLLTGNATERISAGVADPALAGDLNVAHGTPLLIFDRVVFQLNGLPLEWRLGFCHPANGYYVATIG